MKTLSGSTRDLVEKGFSFRCNLLRAGDVLLCTDPNDKLSATIRFATSGTFSHAAICTFRPLFIEAELKTVAEFSMNRMNLAMRGNARILRLKSSIPHSSEIANAAANAALEYQTERYDKIAAAASVFIGAKATSGVFCSYVVAAAYISAGRNITSTAKPPARTTPADIENSPDFDDITDRVLFSVQFEPDQLYYFLDRPTQYPVGTRDEGNSLTPAQAYNVALRTVGEHVSAFLESRGLPQVSNYIEAQKALILYRNEPWISELDTLFSRSIRELALPTIVSAVPVVDAARARDDKSFDAFLNQETIDKESFQATVLEIDQRIETTEALIADRKSSIFAFTHGFEETGFHTLRVWIECEELICNGLLSNLSSYTTRWDRLIEYAAERGWIFEFPER